MDRNITVLYRSVWSVGAEKMSMEISRIVSDTHMAWKCLLADCQPGNCLYALWRLNKRLRHIKNEEFLSPCLVPVTIMTEIHCRKQWSILEKGYSTWTRNSHVMS